MITRTQRIIINMISFPFLLAGIAIALPFMIITELMKQYTKIWEKIKADL